MNDVSFESFFWDHFNNPLPVTKWEKTDEAFQTGKSFMDKDLLTELGQWPIKKHPVRKSKPIEKNSSEVEEEIKKVFWSEDSII